VDARTARLDHADERGVHLETRYLEMLQPREERTGEPGECIS
jgi:hypothetical protein